jgi:hypothetical protein
MIYSTEHFSIQNYALKETFKFSRKLPRYRYGIFGTQPTAVVSGRHVVDLTQIIYYVWGFVLCAAQSQEYGRRAPLPDHAFDFALSLKPVLFGPPDGLQHGTQVAFQMFVGRVEFGNQGRH